jgi:hypothetical protein
MNKIEIVLVLMVLTIVVNMVISGTPGWCENGDHIKSKKCEEDKCCDIWCNGDRSICTYTT